MQGTDDSFRTGIALCFVGVSPALKPLFTTNKVYVLSQYLNDDHSQLHF